MFQQPVSIPPVLVPTRYPHNDVTDYYELRMRQGSTEIVPGTRTAIWGFGGISPGPTVCEPHGRYSVLRQINELPDKMLIHRHGGDQPGEFDGNPGAGGEIEPGEHSITTTPTCDPTITTGITTIPIT